MMNLSSFVGSPPPEQFPVSIRGDLDVVWWCLLRLLLERVEHVHRFREPGHVDDPVLHGAALKGPDADFACTRADLIQRLPILRIVTLLDGPQLHSRHVARQR
ncbi:MAG TPA: hypothetical protein VHG08_27365 [Longimicrobium sp.]|nr:hypothetical protein [Longimicrobium sp.]